MSSPIPEIGERRTFWQDSVMPACHIVPVPIKVREHVPVTVREVYPSDQGPRAYYIIDTKGRSWLCSFIPGDSYVDSK